MEPSAAVTTDTRARGLGRRAVLIGLIGILAVAYGPVLAQLVGDWVRDPNYNHGFLIPLVSAFLLRASRHALRRQTPSPSNLGILGLFLAGAVLIVGTAGAEVFTQRMSFLLVLASLVLFLRGWGSLRLVAFPIVFLFFAIPLPYIIYYALTGPLQALAAKLAVFGLKGVGVPALVQGNMIHLPQTSLEVAEACSGIRSLYAFLAVGALVAHATPVPLWGRLCVFALAIPVSVAGNAARVWGSGMGAYLIGPEATRGTVHELFGILVFIVALGVFILLRKVVRHIWSSDPSSPS